MGPEVQVLNQAKRHHLELHIWKIFFAGLLADPGEARGCSTNSLVINSLIQSVITFLPQLYGAATPKRLEIAPPVIK